MESILDKYSYISLLLTPLLNHNYDCVKLIIKKLKETEINEAIEYHLQQQVFRHSYFSGYSFLYTLRGRYHNGKMNIVKSSKIQNSFYTYKKVYNKWVKNCDFNSDEVKHLAIIEKYLDLLNMPNLSESHRQILLNKLEHRRQKLIDIVGFTVYR